jgi:hypothetical protein
MKIRSPLPDNYREFKSLRRWGPVSRMQRTIGNLDNAIYYNDQAHIYYKTNIHGKLNDSELLQRQVENENSCMTYLPLLGLQGPEKFKCLFEVEKYDYHRGQRTDLYGRKLIMTSEVQGFDLGGTKTKASEIRADAKRLGPSIIEGCAVAILFGDLDRNPENMRHNEKTTFHFDFEAARLHKDYHCNSQTILGENLLQNGYIKNQLDDMKRVKLIDQFSKIEVAMLENKKHFNADHYRRMQERLSEGVNFARTSSLFSEPSL